MSARLSEVNDVVRVFVIGSDWEESEGRKKKEGRLKKRERKEAAGARACLQAAGHRAGER